VELGDSTQTVSGITNSQFGVAIHVTSYRKAYVWEGKLSGKPERVWRIRPEDLAGNRASDRFAVA
jgi:hypothetical protein